MTYSRLILVGGLGCALAAAVVVFGLERIGGTGLAARCAEGAPAAEPAACQQAVADDPDDMDSLNNLAQSLLYHRRYDEAIVAYRTIVARRPDDVAAHFDLASALGFLRRYGEAVAPIEATIRLKPDHIGAYRLAQIIYVQMRRLTDAYNATLRAAELGDPSSMYDLVWHYEDGIGIAADKGKALDWAEQAAERGHIGAMDLMVEVYLEGLYGAAPDDAKAEEWATRARRARDE